MLDVPQDALSRTRYKMENCQSLDKGKEPVTTNVFHESIEESPDPTFSIPRMYCLRQTIPPYRGVVICARCYDFSKDREVTATFEYHFATRHLPDNLSDSGQ